MNETTATLMQSAHAVLVGVLQDFTPEGHPLVHVTTPSVDALIEARTCVTLTLEHIGQSLVMLPEAGRPDRVIVIGVIQGPRNAELPDVGDEARVTLRARDEITLQCGESSITLTRAGKILIRGTYLSSRASGLNRIKGAVVEIN